VAKARASRTLVTAPKVLVLGLKCAISRNRSKEIRQEYVKHVAKMLQLLGDDPDTAAANSQIIMNIETRLAKSSKTRLEMRNIPALYNKKTPKELQDLAPAFDWQRYFKNIRHYAKAKQDRAAG